MGHDMEHYPITLLAVYGSLRKPGHTGRQYLQEQDVHFRDLGPCEIKDCALHYVKNSQPFNFPTTEPNVQGSTVQANLLAVGDDCLSTMDRYEGYPHLFTRSPVTVKYGDREFTAIMYHLTDEQMRYAKEHDRLEAIPNGDWLDFYERKGF